MPLSRGWARESSEIEVLIAAERGQGAATAELVGSLGGRIVRRIDRIDYLRAMIPIERYQELRASGFVSDLVGNGASSYFFDLEPGPGLLAKAFASPEGAVRAESQKLILPVLSAADLPSENPYVPTRDVGAPQFVARNPTFDGRGVTIAIVEGGVDFRHEVFTGAADMRGVSVRKIRGIYASRDPGEDHPLTVKMEVEVSTESGTFEVDGVVYVAPSAGHCRFGVWNPSESSELAMLWNVEQGLLWVDVEGNRDFAKYDPVRDFNLEGDTQSLVQGGPSAAFTFHPDEQAVWIHRASDHTTGVAGIAAGCGFLGGAANGCAPGAQLVLVEMGIGTRGSLVEAFALAASLPDVDLICCTNWAASYPESGESFVPLMLDRIVEVFDKLIVISGGNMGPGLATTWDLSNASRILSVGGYSNRDTLNLSYDRQILEVDCVNPTSSRGPSANGAMKPDGIAPILMLLPRTRSSGQEASVSPIRSHLLPPGYQLSIGTSYAAPLAAGAAALVISAAKQSGVSYDAQRLRWAMRTGARFLPAWPAHSQGAGLFNVEGAWEALRSEVSPLDLQTKAPVWHAADADLRVERTGPGLFEREGWSAGSRGERIIEVVRPEGATNSISLALSWLGNDGTFQTSASIEFPEGEVKGSLRIKIQVEALGPHSAILEFRDPVTRRSLHQMLVTVVASQSYGPDSVFSRSGTLEPLRGQSWFIEMPPGMREIRVEALATDDGEVLVGVNDPSCVMEDLKFVANPMLHARASDGPRILRNPDPGVWEIRVDEPRYQARRPHFELKLSGQKVPETPSTSRRERFEVHHARPWLTDIDVPAKAEAMIVSVEGSELALFLHYIEDDQWYLWDVSMTKESGQLVRVVNPQPGKWRLLVHALVTQSASVEGRFELAFE